MVIDPAYWVMVQQRREPRLPSAMSVVVRMEGSVQGTRPTGSATLLAWLGIVVCGGANAVAIRVGNVDLAPFWGATLRFGLAALLLLIAVAALRASLPRGAAIASVSAYGLLNFAGFYAFAYWGLVDAPSGVAQVMIATSPVLTVVLTALLGLEAFNWQRLVGTLLAVGGVFVVFSDQVEGGVPLASLAALLGASACAAAGGIVAKKFPPGTPLTANAFGMLVGACVLGAISLVAAEPRTLPGELRTWISLWYLVLVGSIGLFTLVLVVLARWSATATSYALLPMPLVTVLAGSMLLDEAIRPLFVVGGALVLVGVYVGAFAPPVRLLRRARATVE
jgi:drug/metabolite transporter (DMT)-like permease